jgi:dihydropteroate synthase
MMDIAGSLLLPRGARRWVIDPVRGLQVATPAGVMGILNATPDSFSDGGLHLDVSAARRSAEEMVAAGATWLDVGGESTRPGAQPVSASEEIARVVPVIRAIHDCGAAVSIDTSKGAVARAALDAGAVMINDVTAGADADLVAAAVEHRCALVLMHMQGSPLTMQRAPRYADVVDEVIAFLVERLAAVTAAGVSETAVLLDPGIGFGKTLGHNLELLRALPRIEAATGRPVLLGISRKSFLAAITGDGKPAADRDADSHLVHALMAPHCAVLRVHDVAGCARALRLAAALRPEMCVSEGAP